MDFMKFLQGVNAYNTGQPVRGGASAFDRLFRTPREVIDEWSISANQTNPADQDRLREGVDRLASELPPLEGDKFGNPVISVQGQTNSGRPVETVEQAPITMMAPPSLGNADWLMEAQAASENRPERKGLFGMKGTLRDVVGILGDAFLVQGGGQAAYMPRRMQERKSDAMVGMTGGIERTPENAAMLAAIERMAYEDPAAAEEMFKQYETTGLNKAFKENQMAQRAESTATNKYERLEKARNYAARLIAAADTEEKFNYAVQEAGRVAAMAGVSMEDLGISEAMTPEQRAVYGAGDMTVQQQKMLPLQERRTAATESQAKSSAIRAARPPAGRAPPQRGLSAVDAEVADAILSGTATPQQQQYYKERLTRGGKSNRFQQGGNAPAVRPGLRIKSVRPAN